MMSIGSWYRRGIRGCGRRWGELKEERGVGEEDWVGNGKGEDIIGVLVEKRVVVGGGRRGDIGNKGRVFIVW